MNRIVLALLLLAAVNPAARGEDWRGSAPNSALPTSWIRGASPADQIEGVPAPPQEPMVPAYAASEYHRVIMGSPRRAFPPGSLLPMAPPCP